MIDIRESLTPDKKARYVLGNILKRPIICIGINPSSATAEKADSTINFVKGISTSNNYDSWVMLNIYPVISTKPRDLELKIDKMAHSKNLEEIGKIFEKLPSVEIWAAWGNLIEKREYFLGCLNDIYQLSKKYNNKWVCIGDITKKKHPRHPRLVPFLSKKQDFNIGEYISQFNR